MATLGTPKTPERFDWNRDLYERLHSSLDSVRRGENVLLRGQAGLGKTTLAQNLGLRELERGHSVRFCTLPAAPADLLRQKSIPQRPHRTADATSSTSTPTRGATRRRSKRGKNRKPKKDD